MTIQTVSKLNLLTHLLPEGLLIDAAWLEEKGYSRALRHQYVGANWLEQPARGVFRRPRGQLSWQQVVISLQGLLKYPVSVGGRTALELSGYAHYLQQTQQHIHLYSDNKCPAWLLKLPLQETFLIHNRTHFLPLVKIAPELFSIDDSTSIDEALAVAGLTVIPWGNWEFPLVISTPERAYLELLDELPQHESFHMADVIMEGLTNLSPLRLQSLLEAASSIKVKRLFFLFAERHNHAWLKRLDVSKIDLGKGKRMLVKGGKFNTKYQITVPKEFAAESVNGIY
ncbi:MAG TPA: type IV toxin-antitoxin system AbiEi family antitoxin domain-containing protein [Cellvibrio sp.]|nr:type IV toxin-antitoxin system AbiEi family antitoxin domain-containing protein [Cellvibrio sp.]